MDTEAVVDEIQPAVASLKSPPSRSVPSARSTATLTHEEAVLRNPFAIRPWLDYINFLSSDDEDVTAPLVFPIYERAVAALPGSYKLWKRYANLFRSFAQRRHPNHPARAAALQVSTRAARALLVSPVLWSENIDHALSESRLIDALDSLNDALRTLPLTQHHHVWQVIRQSFPLKHAPHCAAALFRRYAKFAPEAAIEPLCDALLAAENWPAAITQMANALVDSKWIPNEFSRHEFWLRLARTAATNGSHLTEVDVANLIRKGIKEGGPAVAEMWVALAEFFTRQAMFDEARAVFEEGLASISVARDFAIVFDAYAKLEESLVTAAVAASDSADSTEADEAEVEEHLARLEALVDRRPMLLSDVWLRQNPHNVHEWHKRARMFKAAGDAPGVVDVYTKAIAAVDPHRASAGRPHTLWLAFARYYEDSGELSSARRVLDRAVGDPDAFRSPEDLAAVWSEYAEMELRRGELGDAREVLLRAITTPERVREREARRARGEKRGDAEVTVKAGAGNVIIRGEEGRLGAAWFTFRSPRLWHFLLDLAHTTMEGDDILKLHERMLELRIASASSVLAGAAALEGRRLFELAFRLYDRAASKLGWPGALQVWVVYLSKFVERFQWRKLERARDLFEEAIRTAPSSKKGGRIIANEGVMHLYLMYADMEERFSVMRHAVQVLARAAKAVREEERGNVYRMYIVKVASSFGVTKTRGIYEEAMESLVDAEEVLEFAVRYAEMEMRVGEFDRARQIYWHASQIADARRSGLFEGLWRKWEGFELEYGNKDTTKAMLRRKARVALDHRDVVVDRRKVGALANMVREDGSEYGGVDATGTNADDADAKVAEARVADAGASRGMNDDSQVAVKE